MEMYPRCKTRLEGSWLILEFPFHQISTQYQVRRITEDDLPELLALARGIPLTMSICTSVLNWRIFGRI